MQALTIHQPWAWAIASGIKLVENRDWLPNWRLLKPGDELAIHAGLQLPQRADVAACRHALRVVGREAEYPRPPSWAFERGHGLGTLLALATFDGVVERREDLEESQRPWFIGKYGWRLSNVRQLQMPHQFAVRGQQGLWALPTAIEAKVRSTLERPEGSGGFWRRTAA